MEPEISGELGMERRRPDGSAADEDRMVVVDGQHVNRSTRLLDDRGPDEHARERAPERPVIESGASNDSRWRP